MDKGFGATLCPCNNANYSFTKGFFTFSDRVLICPSVPMDNFDLPRENWFTIGTDRTDGQDFWGLPYALSIMLANSFTKGFCTLTDRVFICPSVPMDNFDLPMENWFTNGTDRTDGQGYVGLPYALAIMLTISFTKGFFTFTDRVFISPSVPTDTDGRNNFTKLTVGMLASVLDNPRTHSLMVKLHYVYNQYLRIFSSFKIFDTGK